MLIPTFGDVVRTYIKVKNLDFDSLFDSVDETPRGIQKIFGLGYPAMPKTISSWLASHIGENITYWQKVNKSLYMQYDNIERFKSDCTWGILPKTVDLYQLKHYMHGDRSMTRLCTIDTVVSSRIFLGMFLLYWTNIHQFTFTNQINNQKISWKIIPPDNYRNNDVLRYLYSKWGEQTDKKAPTVIDLGYMLYLGWTSVPNNNNLSYCGGKFTFKLSVDGENHESQVSPFKGYASLDSRRIKVEWNPQFVNLMSMSAVPDRQIYDDIAWKDYA